MGNLFFLYFLLKSLTYWAYSFLCKCVLMCDSSSMYKKFECFLFSFENPILVYDALWSKSLTLPSHISFPFLMTSYFCVFFCAVSAAYLTAAVIPYAKGRISYHFSCFSAYYGLFFLSFFFLLKTLEIFIYFF